MCKVLWTFYCGTYFVLWLIINISLVVKHEYINQLFYTLCFRSRSVNDVSVCCSEFVQQGMKSCFLCGLLRFKRGLLERLLSCVCSNTQPWQLKKQDQIFVTSVAIFPEINGQEKYKNVSLHPYFLFESNFYLIILQYSVTVTDRDRDRP